MSPESSSAGAAPAPSNGRSDDSRETRQNEMIGSLGEALAGVNLGSNNGFPAFNNNGGEVGWGGFNAPEASRNPFANGNNGREESSNSPQEQPASPQSQQRKQGLDLYLSQSPSQMLGNDVFKQLSTGNLPGLAIPEGERAADGSGAGNLLRSANRR